MVTRMLEPDDFAKVLGEDGFGTLYSVYMPLVGAEVSVYVTDDGEELFPSDMQDFQPRCIDDMRYVDWLRADEFRYA